MPTRPKRHQSRDGLPAEARQCVGKRRYLTFADADRASARVVAREKAEGHSARMATYRCRQCGAWHFGTSFRVIQGASGSPLDAEVERFRREQRERHPADLPGQMRLYEGGQSS